MPVKVVWNGVVVFLHRSQGHLLRVSLPHTQHDEKYPVIIAVTAWSKLAELSVR